LSKDSKKGNFLPIKNKQNVHYGNTTVVFVLA